MSKTYTVTCTYRSEGNWEGYWTPGRYWPFGETVVTVLDTEDDDPVDRSKIGQKTFRQLMEASKEEVFSDFPFKQSDETLEEARTRSALSAIQVAQGGPDIPPRLLSIKLPPRFVIHEGGEAPAPVRSKMDIEKAQAQEIADLRKQVEMLISLAKEGKMTPAAEDHRSSRVKG